MNDKSVLVTGCSSGLGLATALELAARGFRVFATMRELTRRGELEAQAAQRGLTIEVLPLDVTRPETIDAAIATIIERSGTLYGVVNNAGVALRGFFEDLTEEEIRHVFETNVFGTMAVTRAALPHMRAAREGRIVIVTSVGGRQGVLALTGYCASKFALEGFGEALMQEVKPFGIAVSLVAPGITPTPIWDRSIAKNALNPDSPYHALFLEYRRMVQKVMRGATVTPEAVGQSIGDILMAERPQLRYLIGWRPKLLFALRRYLPGESFDRAYTWLVLRRVQGRARSTKTPQAELTP
ncbi:MAG: SDR family oxidoreductase [Anaerolineales bacterium]|nr:SDR family oxidoreductase [Anaerolineales bacterium]MCB9129181.1 SDR family oxidoreductase [Ardenticatenales bacterium]